MTERNEDIEGIEKKLRYLERNMPCATMDPNPTELEEVRSRINRLRSSGTKVPETTMSLLRKVESSYNQSYFYMLASITAAAI